ncbi:CHAP domain-containing protein [Arthrobacter castelli]|uniref:CHAP domain-containing protein n=1 Tax=Arthrobacter castelli TaxID=271431 RepID=UPI0003FE82CF|nr:CHAP domain-containing protein [Arthrobacter castelli]
MTTTNTQPSATPPAGGGGSSWGKWVAAAVAVALLVPMIFIVLLVGLLGGGSASNAACLPAWSETADGITGGGFEPSGTTRQKQIANAKAINAAVKDAGLGGLAAEIAIIAAMGESSLLNISYGDARHGVTNPDGTPTSSIGLFQQQKWWGTKAQRMDPAYATTSFLTGIGHDGTGGLVSVNNWRNRPITQVIHDVQKNAVATHYIRSYAPARDIIAAAGIDINRPSENGPATTDNTESNGGNVAASNECNPGATSGQASDVKNAGPATNDYPWQSRTPGPGIYNADPLGFFYGECTSFVAWRLNRDAGGTAQSPYEFTNSTGGVIKGNGAQWRAAWEQLGWKVSQKPVEGAVAWWGSNGAPGIGPAGHVAYVHSVDGSKVHIEEYNNVALAPPGHKYSQRTIEASDVNAFLYPPPLKD